MGHRSAGMPAAVCCCIVMDWLGYFNCGTWELGT
jgi:hypothetical protein